MWYILAAVLIVIYFLFVINLINLYYQNKQEQKAFPGNKGIISSINEIKIVKGIPEIAEGSKVSISLYNDKITINDNIIIPLEKVEDAST